MKGSKVEILANRGIFYKGDIGYYHSNDGSNVLQHRIAKDKSSIDKYLHVNEYEYFDTHEFRFIEFAEGDKVMYKNKAASVNNTNRDGRQVSITFIDEMNPQWVMAESLEHINVEELMSELDIGDKVKFKWRAYEGTGNVVTKTDEGYLTIDDGFSPYHWTIFVSDVELIEEETVEEDIIFKKGDFVNFNTFGEEYFGTVVGIDGSDVIIKDGEDDLLFDWTIPAGDVRFRPKFEDGDEVICACEDVILRGVIVEFDEEYNSYLIQLGIDELIWRNEGQFMLDRNVFDDVRAWAKDKGLDEVPPEKQYLKVAEETGEIAASLARGKNPIDDIGDAGVTLEIIANIHGFTLEEAVEHAYNEIKDRTGKLVDGVFVKDEE